MTAIVGRTRIGAHAGERAREALERGLAVKAARARGAREEFCAAEQRLCILRVREKAAIASAALECICAHVIIVGGGVFSAVLL